MTREERIARALYAAECEVLGDLPHNEHYFVSMQPVFMAMARGAVAAMHVPRQPRAVKPPPPPSRSLKPVWTPAQTFASVTAAARAHRISAVVVKNRARRNTGGWRFLNQ